MSFVEILKVIVLGIVEGFTEWLPISSTGHMILVDEIIHLEVSEAFRDPGGPGPLFSQAESLFAAQVGRAEAGDAAAVDENCRGLHPGGGGRPAA